MKYIFLGITLVLSLFLISSCNRSDREQNSSLGELCQVSLSLRSEGIDIEDTPLSLKSPTTDVYAVQIYSKLSEGGTYAKYGYGLFDDLSTIKLELPSGSIYKFEVTMIEDCRNRIAIDPVSNTYRAPFVTNGIGGGGQSVGNKFTISRTNYFAGLMKGYASVPTVDGTSFDSFRRPLVNRHYGVVDGFQPKAGEQNNIRIDLKRAVFGLRFIPENMPQGAHIVVAIEHAPVFEVTADVTHLISFDNSAGGTDWIMDEYSEQVPIRIDLVDHQGTVTTISDQTLTFARKRLYTIRMKLANGATEKPFEIVKESETLLPTEEIVVQKGLKAQSL